MFYYHLRDAIILEAKGADVQRYLNARLTNNVKNLAINATCEAAALNAQGKTLGVFLVLKRAPEDFLLICDGGNPEEVISALGQFIVADRVTLSDLSKSHSLVHLSEMSASLGVSDALIIEHNRLDNSGVDLILNSKQLNEIVSSLNSSGAILLTADDWKLKLITHGKPSFPNELNSKFLFSEAGLDQAISFNKGCYVGQEVIEKIDAFAKSPFTLKHGYLEGEIEMIDEYIVADGEQNKVGTLISSAYDKEVNKTFCFFRLKNKSEVLSSNQLKLNGQTIRLFA